MGQGRDLALEVGEGTKPRRYPEDRSSTVGNSHPSCKDEKTEV